MPHLECVPCLVRQAREAIAHSQVDTAAAFEVLQQALHLLSQLNLRLPPPVLAQRVHRLVRRLTRCEDPYVSVKARLNEQALRQYPVWHDLFHRDYPRMEAAARLAIIGNLMDVGAKTNLDPSGVKTAFERALSAPLHGSIEGLSSAIRNARSILFLADNAGEIVFDRDLLAKLPLGKFTVAVRGRPVLNDATATDAEQAGLTDFCELISNGSDGPGTILEDCSPTFRDRFEAADLVIAKGQGNYETLAGTHKEIFFLLNVKCEVLSQALGVPIGSLVLHHQRWTGSGKLNPLPGTPQLTGRVRTRKRARGIAR